MVPVCEKLAGSVDRYTPRGPVAHRLASCGAMCCLLSLMAPRVCTLVLSFGDISYFLTMWCSQCCVCVCVGGGALSRRKEEREDNMKHNKD